MSIRIGDYLEKNHKFTKGKILHAMKLSGMLEENKSYNVNRNNIYNIRINKKHSQNKRRNKKGNTKAA
ncbi:hypothetical protein LNK15_03330 [Jeotgalicoccus huakuii]|nr:hypothetical protein [Jeotgalicoccus huakuii]